MQRDPCTVRVARCVAPEESTSPAATISATASWTTRTAAPGDMGGGGAAGGGGGAGGGFWGVAQSGYTHSALTEPAPAKLALKLAGEGWHEPSAITLASV